MTQPKAQSNAPSGHKKKNRKNKQKKYYSGKKKKHTVKTQLVVQEATGRIICTDFCEGKKHDFRLFKESRLPLQKTQKLLLDTGYVGIKRLPQRTFIPKKRSKKKPLTKKDKAFNKAISKRRVFVENVIGDLKKFKIISERYRNRRHRFSMRFNIIAGGYNHEL